LVTSSGAGQTFTIDGNLTAALGVTVTAGSIAGTGTLDGILNYMSSTNSTFAGVIANTVPVSTLTMNKAGAILTLTGANTYSGVTNVTAGTLQIGNGGSTGRLGTGNVVDNGILAFDWSTASTTVANAISGTGALNQIGSGTTILNGTETYTGATNVIAGTLEVDSSLAAGSTVNVATGGKLTGTGTIHGKATMTGNGSIDLSSGAVIAGTLAVTGGNWTGQGTVGGAVTSSGGLFTIANGATLTATAGLNVTGGTLAGPGTLAGSLNYTSSASSSFNGNIVDGLAPSSLTMNKAGSTLTLSGTYTYTGPTTITSGTLFLGDTALGNTAVTVNSGGILAGGAPVAGPVTVNSGGTLSVGASTFASTMTTGPLTLKTGAKVDYLLGAAGAIGFGTNDLTDVNGNLALAGTLNLTAGFGFGAGNTYELFSYIGTATGALTLGTLPAGFTASNFTLTNNTAAKEITLTVTGGPVAQYWNGPVTTANNAINGGSGTWDNITTNWTNSSGATNTAWAQSIAVFSTGSGIVTTGDNLTVAALGFVPGTGQYTVNVSPNNTLTITGAGVSNTSGQAQSIVNVADGSGAFGSIVFKNSASASTGNSVQYTNQAGAAAASITFQNSSTAGNAAIINSGGTIDSGSGGSITFQNSSTAGNATISNNGGTVSNAAGAIIFFQGTSTAGSARITNNGGTADSAGGAITSFSNTATAGTATIVVNGATVTNGLAGTIIFNNSSTAGHATIIANGSTVAGASGGFLSFSDTSTAGNASITTNGASASGSVAGVTAFSGSSTAGAATLITTGGTNGGPGGITLFQNTADGGTAQALTNGNGSFDISNLTSAGMKIGSIAGSGTYNLGAKTLTVGGNNLSTVVSGNITDAGDSGSLVKTGTGTLTLSGPNSYTGSTTVNAGILQVGNGSAGNLASASVAVTGTATLVTDLAAASTFTPSVALNAATTALKATQSGTNTLSGVISGSGVFDQTGPGTTILTKTETYTGATNVTAGTLQIGNGTSGNLASASAVTVSGSATLATDLAIATFFTSKVNLSTSASSFEALQFGSDFINGVISGPGSFNQNGSGTTIFTGVTQAYTGPTNVNSGTLEVDTGTAAGSTVNVGTNGTLTGAGKILGKATLTGNGTIKLAASASIAGPLSVTGGNWANVGKVTGLVTASSGTFDVTGDLTASGGVAVSGGTLAGSGTVTGAVTLNNNGTVAPGAATPGAPGTTLHATSMTWNSGGTITLQLGSSANDVLALTGALTKGSAGAYTLDILDDGGIPLDSYTLATFASTTFLATSFTLDMPTGYVGHLVETKTSLTLDVTSGSGQEPGHSESADLATAGNASAMPASTIDAGSSLSITPTPEPGSAMLLIFGGAALLGWRRRQRLV
jgi:autotransporter-associated beta strand protein